MIGKSHRACKCTLLSESGSTAWLEHCSLVVAETGKCSILSGKAVVQTCIEFVLAKSSDGLVGVVVTILSISGVRDWVQLHHRQSDWINHIGRDLVTVLSATRLYPARARWNWVTGAVTLKR